MPVAVRAAAVGHGATAFADEHHRLLGADHACRGGGGELADRVAGSDADLAVRVRGVREDGQEGDETGADKQRLGHRGVADLLRVGLGAVAHQVQSGAGGEPAQALGHSGELEPRAEETGGLGALSGRDDDEHPSTVPDEGGNRIASPTNLRSPLWRIPQTTQSEAPVGSRTRREESSA